MEIILKASEQMKHLNFLNQGQIKHFHLWNYLWKRPESFVSQNTIDSFIFSSLRHHLNGRKKTEFNFS
jgi:hypothetical protein